MPSPALKCVSVRQDNTQIASLGVWEEVKTVDGGSKVMHERMTDADGAKVAAKKEAKQLSNSDENKVDEKRESEKPCTVSINKSTSVSLRKMYNLTDVKDGGTGEGGVLVTQDRIVDADTAKVDVNAKADAPDAFDASNIETTKIDVKRGIVKMCSVSISLSRCVYLIQQSLCNTRNTMKGSPGATNTNPDKNSFCLLGLITEIQNVSMAIGQFRTTHEENIGDTGYKHLGVIMV